MAIDYKLIADDDPGGDLGTAYATMAASMVTVERSSTVFTGHMIAQEIGIAAANQFLNDVELAAPARVMGWFNDFGLDLSDPDVVAYMTSINPANLAAVLALTDESQCKYGTNFKMGHLQNARQYRADGKI